VKGGSGGGPRPVDVPVKVKATNNYALPVDIFAVSAGINQRLGTVHPGMTSEFTVPPTLVGGSSVELQARPSDRSGVFRSGPLLLAPGTIVDFVIAAQLFNSTATLRM
jgi:hypothetical protein